MINNVFERVFAFEKTVALEVLFLVGSHPLPLFSRPFPGLDTPMDTETNSLALESEDGPRWDSFVPCASRPESGQPFNA